MLIYVVCRRAVGTESPSREVTADHNKCPGIPWRRPFTSERDNTPVPLTLAPWGKGRLSAPLCSSLRFPPFRGRQGPRIDVPQGRCTTTGGVILRIPGRYTRSQLEHFHIYKEPFSHKYRMCRFFKTCFGLKPSSKIVLFRFRFRYGFRGWVAAGERSGHVRAHLVLCNAGLRVGDVPTLAAGARRGRNMLRYFWRVVYGVVEL